MSTVRPGVMEKAEKSDKGSFVIRPNVDDKNFESRIEFLNINTDKKKTVDLLNANIVVSGGRGLKSPKGFKLIEELAKSLGGVVESPRAAVDAGWIDQSHQIG